MRTYSDLFRSVMDKQDLRTFEGLDSHFQMKAGASSDDIVTCNSNLGGRLPNDYRLFLSEFDGGTLFGIQDFAGFKLFGVDELQKENDFQKSNFGSDWDEEVILFALSLGDGEYFGFKSKRDSGYLILDCLMDSAPSGWTSIGSSFADFICRLIEEKGRKFWL